MPGQRGDVELGQFGGPQRRRETDEQQGAVVQPGQGVGIARKAARNNSTTSAVFSERPAVGAADPGKGRRHRGRGTVADGRKALDLAAQGAIRPDLIVADYNLPQGLNGLQAVAGLRETLGREVPAVILTGDISTGTLREIAQDGYLHLNKPVKARELTDLIRRCLAGPPPPLRVGPRHPGEPAGDSPQPPSNSVPTIFVVNDDGAVREAMRALLRANGWTVETYASSEAFLDAYHPGGEGCLLLIDARMPGMSGLDLLQQLKGAGDRLPAIMITGQGDVPMAVEAMRAGAADFIAKPIRGGELIASIGHALEHVRDAARLPVGQEAAVERLAGLTTRQRQIMALVLAGHPSKNIAADLGVSQRTVENHRAAIMKKTGSHSLSALIRLALAADPGGALSAASPGGQG